MPPGQYLTADFPVLSAGPTPHTPLDEWSFTIHGAVDEPVSWPWAEFLELPSETVTVDIHCVTKWSKLDTAWRGVSVDTLLSGVQTEAEYLTAWSDGGYTTNLALEDVTDGRAWSRTSMAANHSILSTAGRLDCSSRICTSGKARSGYVG